MLETQFLTTLYIMSTYNKFITVKTADMENSFSKRLRFNFLNFSCLIIFLASFFGSDVFGQTTVSFAYTGANQTWTCPQGVTSITVKVWGAGGSGAGGPSAGGSGAFVTGTMAVTPGTTYVLIVGGGGTYGSAAAGGFGGGGQAGTGTGGASGGGYSGIFTTSVSQANALVVAGGGGAAGYYGGGTYGGAGGATSGTAGGNRTAGTFTGGGGGTTSAGGAGGVGGVGGVAGSALAGGKGANNTYGGGGGGGGYFGGGGGYAAANTTNYSSGGGGGSSFISSSMSGVTNTVGTTNTTAVANQAPGSAQSGYVAGCGNGGASSAAGGNGLIVITIPCTAPVAPTTISGTTSICPSSTTTLTASGGTTGTEGIYYWYSGACPTNAFAQHWTGRTNPYTPTTTTVNKVDGGYINLTSTNNDPNLNMTGLGSFSPTTYKYVNVRFRVTSVTQVGAMEIFWYNTANPTASGSFYKNQPITSVQNVWQTVSIDMTTPSAGSWTGSASNITGWRFDWTTNSGVTMDIDFVSLSSSPIIGEGTTYTTGTAGTYYSAIQNACGLSTCQSATVTVGTQATAGTFQYSNASTQTFCAGGSISCTNSTAPTNGGSGTVSTVWYCGELLSGTPGSGGTYGNWVRSTTGGTALLSATGTNATSLTNYNPQTDFPGKTNFYIIRRAYTDICGECAGAGGCLDQMFYLNVNAVSATPAITGTYCPGATTVSGTGVNGSTISVIRSGSQIGTATVSGGVWTATVSTLAGADILTATQTESGKCVSVASASNTVLSASAAPIITGPICPGSTTVSGTGINGSSINVIRSGSSIGTATVSGGVWTATVSTVNAGDALTATQTEVGKCVSATASYTVITPASWGNIQFPTSQPQSICGSPVTFYGQVYRAGTTEAAGQGASLTADLGWSNTNTNPNTWTNWTSASFNAQSGNNDEFTADLGAGLTTGPWYYAFRYNYAGCPIYGGYGGVYGSGGSNGQAIVPASQTISLTSSVGTNAQTVCKGSAISAINYTVGNGATGASITGLPAGITGSYSGGVFTISGTPTVSGVFNYTVTTSGATNCVVLIAGTVTVSETLDFVNLQFPSTASICFGSTANIFGQVYEAGLTNPAGQAAGITVHCGISPVSSNTNPNTWSNWTAASFNTQSGNNDEYTATIGSALSAGTYYYAYRYSYNGCVSYGGYSAGGGGFWDGSSNVSGVLTVNPTNTASSASSSPTLCINTALTAITHTTAGATGIGSPTGLPTGVTASWSSNTISITGTPTATGTFNYSIPLTGGCGSVNATGTIIVTPINSAGVASSTPTVCNNSPLTTITHTTVGATGIGTATGLPTGVSAAWSSNTISITGTPTGIGTFNYSIPLTGGCGSANATGTITVTQPTVNPITGTTTLCVGQTSTLGGNTLPYTIQSITSVGTTSFTPPATGVAEVLVVAGGGGGGFGRGGGGGGGGVIYNSSYSVTAGSPISVTVGAGGTGGTTNVSNSATGNGQNSVFGTITATGGGLGGSHNPTTTSNCAGLSGGSGGGGAINYSSSSVWAGGTASPAGQGFAGGTSGPAATDNPRNTGGGGGAGGVGVTSGSSTTAPPNGGAGISYSISGSAVFYGGGGGGADGRASGETMTTAGAGTGGTGGGGNGAAIGGNPTSGAANTGGGGGGGGSGGSSTSFGGNGGSGIVIVKYPSSTWSWTSSNPSVATVNASTGVVTAVSAGITTITFTLTTGGCSNSASTTVTVNANPTAVATSNTPVCGGSALNLTGTTNIGTTFSWTGPNGFTSTSQNPSISNPTSAVAGTYAFTASLNGCSATGNTVVAFISGPTSVTGGSNATICYNTSTTLAGSAVAPNVNVTGSQTFTWQGSGNDGGALGNGNSVTGTTTGLPTGSTITSITYTTAVRYTSYTGTSYCGNYWNANLLVNNASIGSACGVSNISYSGLNGAAANNQTFKLQVVDADLFNDLNYVTLTVVVNYQYPAPAPITYAWSPSTGLSNAAISNPVATLTSIATYTMTATSNGCSVAASPITITVRPQFTSGAIATTGETICSGGTPSQIGSSTAASGGDNSITYSWRSSADGYVAAISGATSATYTPPAGLTSTTSYRRYAIDNTCNLTPTVSTGTWTVTVNSVPTAGTIASSQIICSGTAPSLFTSSSNGTGTGAVSYEWQTNASGSYATIGSEISSTYQAPVLSATTSYQRRTVALSGGVTCYSTYTSPVTITVNSNPTLSGITSSSTTVCAGDVATITLSGILDVPQTISYTIGGTVGTQTATVTGVGGSASFNTVTLTTANGGQTVTITGITRTDVTPNCPFIPSSGNTATLPSVNSCSLITPSTSSLTAFTACTNVASSEQSFTVIGSDLTADILVTAPTGFQVSLNSGSGFGSSVSLTQSAGSVASTTIYVRMLSASTPVNGNITLASSGAVTQNVSVSGSVNQLLSAVSISGTNNQIICSNASGSLLTVSETNGGVITSRQWGYRTTSGGAITSISGVTGTTYTPSGADLPAGISYIVCTSTPTCGSAVVSNEITVTETLLPTITASTSNFGCGTGTVGISATASAGTIEWFDASLNGTSQGTSNSAATWTTPSIASTTIFYAEAVNGSCRSTARTAVTATVNSIPTVTFTAQPGSTSCSSSNVTYTTQSGQANYVWTFPGTLNTDYTITSGGTTSSNTVTLQYLTAGSKTVSVNYASSGCSALTATSSTATTVSVTPAAPAASNVTICAGESANLVATSAGNSINWYDQQTGGTLLSSLVQSGVNYSVSPLTTTTYYAEAATTSTGSPQTVSFTNTGALQTWTVPNGVFSIDVKMWGAGGAGGSYNATRINSGGSGGYVSGSLNVTPGQVLNLVVGSGGKVYPNNTTSQYGGGGAGGSSLYYCGGGGGRSAIQFVSGTDYVTAGGGGGGGTSRLSAGNVNTIGIAYGGAGGGVSGGASGATYNCGAATGGTQSAGGTQVEALGNNGGSGSIYTGGNGNTVYYGSGGGGGGYYGGAGGGCDWWNGYGNGGGGGSSYVANLTSSVNTQGNINTAGAQAAAPNSSDANYISGVGIGGAGGTTNNGGNGLVVITYTQPVVQCASPRTPVIVTVNPTPTANVGSAMSAICAGQMSGAMGGSVGGSATGGNWSGGTGTWTNANNPSTATYTAGASESGIVTLTLTTSGGGCVPITATKTIFVNSVPTANAGADATICNGLSTTLSGTFTLQPIYSDNFASNSGWTLGSGFAIGSATSSGTCSSVGSDPSTDFTTTSDNGILGFQIGGCYPASMGSTIYAVSPTINLAGYTSASMSFYRWLGVENNSWDHAYIDVFNGTSWVNIFSNGATSLDDNAWTLMTYDISAYVNANFKVRFGMGGSDGTVQYYGWNIDDLTINAVLPATYAWSPSTGLSAANIANPVASPTSDQTYSLAVTTNGCTSSADQVTVFVNPVSVGGTASENQTICTGSSPANITLTGNTGNIQWQVSSDNVTFSNIASATSSTLTSAQMGTLTATRYYRASVTSGVCSAANSNVITVTVNANSVAGSVSSNQTICYNASPSNITLTGNTGTIQWQVSTDNLSFTDIVGATASPLTGAQMGTLTATTYYRAVVTNSPCSSINSASVTVTVLPALTMSGTLSACIGATSDLSVPGETDWTLPTGGTITTIGNDRIHTFTSSGTFTSSQAIPSARAIVVGGGGGGGSNGGGGGGAGGFYQNNSLSISSGATTVTIGAGGAVHNNLATPNTAATIGGQSAFGSITAGGGGGGASRDNGVGGQNGGTGTVSGSGGGGGGSSATPRNSAGTGTFSGGVGTAPDLGVNATGGGGGGAGGSGSAGVSIVAGNGGIGVQSNISGTNLWYAGGGGGGTTINGTNGTGGSGVGGNGESTAGSTNTGSGGGAERVGAAGVVIVRYTIPTWVSSNPAVATVNQQTGVVTAVSTGTTTITYTSTLGCTAIQTFTVNPIAIPASVATATGATLASGDLLWTGNSTTVWGLNTNWVAYDGTNFVVPGAGIAPTANDRVFVLPSSTSGICISATNNTTVTAAGTAKDVFIGSGATMVINAGQSLQVNGDWTNNGTFTPNATANVEFAGGAAQTIGGSSANYFTNLTLNKSANTLTLNTSVTVSGTLTMTAGNIATSASNLLTVGTSPASPGSIAWTGGTVVGPLKRYISGTTSSTQASGIFPVGLSGVNRYAQVNYTSGLTTGGSITAEYKAGSCPVLYAGLPNTVNGQMIQNYENEGYWSITPTGGDLNSATYSLILRGNTLSTVTSPADMVKLRIIKSTSHTSWEMSGIGSNSGTTGGVSDFTIANTGMTGFSFFNIGSGNANPLPVTLLDFSANCNEKSQVNVQWTTASEQNSQSFIIERSRDLTEWQFVTTVNAAGNSNYNIDYSTIDTDPFSGVSYYRLVQVDFNGQESIYGPISVACAEAENSMVVFPNPTTGNFTVEISTDQNLNDSQLIITDLSGKVISTRNINVLQGKTQAIFENQDLQLGTYIIQLNSSNHNIQPVRVVVN